MGVEPGSSADILSTVEECRRLSCEMLDAAEAGDWPEVSRLDEARREGLGVWSLEHLNPDAAASAAEVLRELLALNARLVEAAARARQESLTGLRAVRGRSRGSATYQKLAAGA